MENIIFLREVWVEIEAVMLHPWVVMNINQTGHNLNILYMLKSWKERSLNLRKSFPNWENIMENETPMNMCNFSMKDSITTTLKKLQNENY